MKSRRGFTLKDTEGGHTLHIGLSPGPGDRHAPFLQLRDREGSERFSLGLHAESDEPHFRMQGEQPDTTLELSPNSVMIYSGKGDTRASVGIAGVDPQLKLLKPGKDQKRKSILITPDTRLP